MRNGILGNGYVNRVSALIHMQTSAKTVKGRADGTQALVKMKAAIKQKDVVTACLFVKTAHAVPACTFSLPAGIGPPVRGDCIAFLVPMPHTAGILH